MSFSKCDDCVEVCCHCPKCQNHPCKCGWEYRNGIREVRLELAANILGIESFLIEKTVGHLIPDDHPMKNQ